MIEFSEERLTSMAEQIVEENGFEEYPSAADAIAAYKIELKAELRRRFIAEYIDSEF